MSEQTPNPLDFGEDRFPVRRGDWLINDAEDFAQVRAVYLDGVPGKPGEFEFLIDIYYYVASGRKIGRRSENEPFEIAGKTYRGPRAFEPMCSMDGWRRIKPPSFPLERQMLSFPDSKDPAKTVLRYGYEVEHIGWGNYGRRIRKPVPVVAVTKPNFDPELEKRSRLMAAQAMRDAARERGGDDDLIRRAEALEAEARSF